MRELLTIGRYFKAKYNSRVRKIPISLQGFTCPNIDGSVAKGGCIYCKNETFSPSLKTLEKTTLNMNFSLSHNPLLEKQLQTLQSQFLNQANFHKDKYGTRKFMMYFQSFSNTYAPYETLKALYDKAMSFDGVVGMSIGTRIDTIEDNTLKLLSSYNSDDIWLEYGIQSIFNKTLKLINRGHGIDNAKELVQKTHNLGIKVCIHLIYGLPKESKEMMLESLQEVLSWGIDGIKIHPLYVVKGTPLEQMYLHGKYEPIRLDTYIDLIVKSLSLIPHNVVIQRLSSGVYDEGLLAPKWCFDKNIQMRSIRDALLKIGIKY